MYHENQTKLILTSSEEWISGIKYSAGIQSQGKRLNFGWWDVKWPVFDPSGKDWSHEVEVKYLLDMKYPWADWETGHRTWNERNSSFSDITKDSSHSALHTNLRSLSKMRSRKTFFAKRSNASAMTVVSAVGYSSGIGTNNHGIWFKEEETTRTVRVSLHTNLEVIPIQSL